MTRFLAVLCAFLFIAAGCGQSGPLYIPGNPSRIEQPPPAAESTTEDEDEDEENGDEGR